MNTKPKKSISDQLNDIASEIKTLQISEVIYQNKLYDAYNLFNNLLIAILNANEISDKSVFHDLINKGIEKTYDYRNHVKDVEHADISSYSVVIFIRNLFPLGATRIEDANILRAMISLALRANRKVLVSAKGVAMHTKLFWALSIGYLYGEVPTDRIESLLVIDGINRDVASWLKDIMNEAKSQVNTDDIQADIKESLIDISEV